MSTLLENSLYEKNSEQFRRVTELTRIFMANYCVQGILGENIFRTLGNYAKKNDATLELLRYPFRDDQLWAFTFLKKGTLFVCVNSDLPINKQVFAAAHELYHIYCYVDDVNKSVIYNGSLLDAKTADEVATTQEDLEANAFAALLLVPEHELNEQIRLNSISKESITMDDIISLMDFFGVPYKAMVLRLYESQILNKAKSLELLMIPTEDILRRINVTGIAKHWILDGHGLETFGSLQSNLEFNCCNDFLTASRQEEDLKYLSDLKVRLNI